MFFHTAESSPDKESSVAIEAAPHKLDAGSLDAAAAPDDATSEAVRLAVELRKRLSDGVPDTSVPDLVSVKVAGTGFVARCCTQLTCVALSGAHGQRQGL